MNSTKELSNHIINVILNKFDSTTPGEKDSLDIKITDKHSFNEYYVNIFIEDMNLPKCIDNLYKLNQVLKFALNKDKELEFNFNIDKNNFNLKIICNQFLNEFNFTIKIPKMNLNKYELIGKKLEKQLDKLINMREQRLENQYLFIKQCFGFLFLFLFVPFPSFLFVFLLYICFTTFLASSLYISTNSDKKIIKLEDERPILVQIFYKPKKFNEGVSLCDNYVATINKKIKTL